MNLIVSLLFAIVFSVPTHTDEITQILAKFDNVKYSDQYVELYRSLFSACDASELASLNANKNDSIATQSAWERFTMTVPKESAETFYRPDAAKLNWFVGFFEGETVCRHLNGGERSFWMPAPSTERTTLSPHEKAQVGVVPYP